METVDNKVMSTEELNLVRRYRQQQDFQLGFYAGILAAEKHLESLANECVAGSGTGERAAAFRIAAKSISLLEAPTPK